MPTALFIQAQPPHWIPAFAGMTAFFELSSSRFAAIASPCNALPLIAQIYSGQQCAKAGIQCGRGAGMNIFAGMTYLCWPWS